MSWLNKMFPWPARRERRQAIDAARQEKERSRARAEQAARVREQLTRLASANHYAESIQEQILRGHGHRGR